MSESNLPQLFFYLVFFVITIMLRFMRVYAAKLNIIRQPQPATGSGKSEYFYFGFDLVNVAAGVFILLAQSSTAFLSVFFMVYMALAIVGLFLDIVPVPGTLKASGHLLVSAAIVAVTIYAFVYDGIKHDGVKPLVAGQERVRAWRVAVPYLDMSLIGHFSPKRERIASVYQVKVSAANRGEAVVAARAEFESDKGPRPFKDTSERSPATMIVLDKDIVAEPASATNE